MSKSSIKSHREALDRLRIVIQQGQKRLAHSATVDPQEYFYSSIVASVNKAIQERYETE